MKGLDVIVSVAIFCCLLGYSCGNPTTLDASNSASSIYSGQRDNRESSLISDIVVHLLGVIEQINRKLETVEVKVEEVKNEISAIEMRVASKIKSENDHLEDRIKLQLLQHQGSREECANEAEETFDISEIKTDLYRFSKEISDNLTSSLDKLRRDVECSNENSSSNLLATDITGENVVDIIDRKITAISSALDEKMRASLATMETDARELLTNKSAISSARFDSLEGVLRDVLQPATCKKGMVALPYTIIYPDKDSPINIPYVCDSKTQLGGWIVFQRRQSGLVNFDRTWDEYRNGFGSLADEFWLGLNAIYNLTHSSTYQLRIDLIARGQRYFAEYSTFAVSAASEKFILQIGEYSGTAGDKMDDHRWMPFTTRDRDNDNRSSKNCATYSDSVSGWWYNDCGSAFLNSPKPQDGQLHWSGLSSVTFSEMKMRKVSQD